MAEAGEQLDDDRWTKLIEGLRTSDDAVLREFYDRYDGALHLVVRRRLSPGYLRRFDSDDVVQSTLRTFFRRVQTGHLEMQQGQRLWNLLCAIALTKLREKVRFHSRLRRAIQRECSLQGPEGTVDRAAELAAPVSGPSEEAEFAEAFEFILQSLDEKDRLLVELRLQGCSNQEIANELTVSDRTVQRMLTRLAERFESLLPGG